MDLDRLVTAVRDRARAQRKPSGGFQFAADAVRLDAKVREPLRVLLLEIPQLLRGILEHALQLDGECELTRDSRRGIDVLTEHLEPPDIVILGLTAAEDATLVPAILTQWPHARVMTVTQTGDNATLYQLRPEHRPLGELSAAGIVRTLRDSMPRSHEVP